MRAMRRLAAALALLAAACAPASAPAPAPLTKLTVGYSNLVPSNWPIYLAKDAGIFERNGLDVDITLVEGGARTVAALISGQLQLAHAGGSEMVSAAAGGADVVVIGTNVARWPYVLMVAPEIKAPADLKGKKLGIVTVGGSFDIAARVALPKVGLQPDKDVAIIATGSTPNVTAAMISGAVQAGLAQPPDTLVLEDKGFRTLVDLASLDLPTASNTMALQRTYVAANRDAVQRYTDSIVEAIARGRKDKAFALQVFKRWLKTEDERAANVTYDLFFGRVFQPIPHATPQQFTDAIEQLGKANEKVRTFDVAKILDDSFMRSAEERGVNTR